MNIFKMSRRQFERLPSREWDEDVGEFDSLVIMPTRHVHDSGFRCIECVAAIKEKPICRLAGGSDVINLDGIGGYGHRPWNGIPSMVPPKGWSVDCLKKSGLLRLFANHHKLEAGPSLSNFEIYATRNKR